jgi:hypothetical protein
MNTDNIKHNKPVVVGETPKLSQEMRDKLKAKIKEIVKEMTTSGAAGSGAGSAGVPKLPFHSAKVKDPTAGLAGYKQVGSKETGTLAEKKKDTADAPKNDDAPKKAEKEKKPKSGHDEPMIKPEDPLTVAQKALKIATDRLDKYNQDRKKGKGKVE